MRHDHGAIRERIAALRQAELADTRQLEEVLYGLHALIIVHFAKEEEVYLPLLEAEPEQEVRALLDRMTASGHDAHAH